MYGALLLRRSRLPSAAPRGDMLDDTNMTLRPDKDAALAQAMQACLVEVTWHSAPHQRRGMERGAGWHG